VRVIGKSDNIWENTFEHKLKVFFLKKLHNFLDKMSSIVVLVMNFNIYHRELHNPVLNSVNYKLHFRLNAYETY